jgi:hypothetical protein
MRTFTGLAAIIAVALLAACGTTQYVIGTKTGQLIVADGAPELDRQTNMYRYRDSNGKAMTINAAEVTQIIER